MVLIISHYAAPVQAIMKSKIHAWDGWVQSSNTVNGWLFGIFTAETLSDE